MRGIAGKGTAMAVTVNQIDEKTWSFEEPGVRFFLLAGSEKALMIDTGKFTEHVRGLAEGLTDLPLELLNTHADPDHTAGNGDFDHFYMHPAEATNYYNSHPGTGEMIPVWDGDVLDLGERPLKIITLPGHTPGSIAILDVKNRRIFTGDPVQTGRIFMFGLQREMHAYRISLLKLQTFADQFDLIYPSHADCPVKPELIMKLYEAAGKVMAGEVPGKDEEVFGTPITAYDVGAATFLRDRMK